MATYYVKTGGSDAADGLSDANAWATWGRVATKFTAGTVAGDQILFRGGDSFTATGAVIPNNAGTAAAPITIGSYGTGKATINSTAAVIGGLIYNNQFWIVVQDLNLVGPGKTLTTSSNTGLHFDTGASDCKFLRLDVSGYSNVGLNTNGDRCVLSGSSIHDIGAHAIISGDPGDQFEMTDCTVYGWGGNSTYEAGGRHGIYLESKNGVIWNNEFYSPDAGVTGQGISVRKALLRIYDNVLHDMPAGMGWFNYDPAAVSNLTPGFAWIYGNRMYNLANYAFYIDGSSPAARVGGPGIYKNTVDLAFVNNSCHFSAGGAADYAIAMDTTNPNIDASTRIVNNVIFGTPGKYLKLANPTRAGKTLVEKKNLFFGATQANPYNFATVDYANLGAYQTGSSQGTGDLTSDPLLVAPPDFEPSVQSAPVVEVGATDGESGGIVYSLTEVIGPTKRGWGYRGSAPDIGAVELYHAPVARPNFSRMPPVRAA